MQRVENGFLSDVSGFRRSVVETFALIGRYETYDASYRHIGQYVCSVFRVQAFQKNYSYEAQRPHLSPHYFENSSYPYS